MVALKSSGSAWVRPAAPLTSTTIPCSPTENICAQVHHSVAIFFKVQDDIDALQQYEHMREGLSLALCQQPVWAGTLQQDTRGAWSVNIPPAPKAGVQFHYKDLSRDPTFPALEDFDRAGYPYAFGSELDGLSALRPEPFPESKSDEPTCVPQLTYIKGGMVLTVSMSHLLSDIMRARDFVINWGECTRAVIAGKKPIPPQLPFELNDKSPLTPTPRGPATTESMLERSKNLPNFKLMDLNDPAGTISEMQNWQPKSYIPSRLASQEEYLRSAIAGVWRIEKDFFTAASKYGAEAEPRDVRVSSMDILTAFLWGRLFLAKYPPKEGAEPPAETTIVHAIDVRRRLNPPLPHKYQGAAVDILRSTVSLETVQKANAGDMFGSPHLKAMALATRKAQAAWSQDQYMSLLELVQQTALSPGMIPLGPIDFLVTDHRGFRGTLEANFGSKIGAGVAWREPYIGRAIPTGEIEFMPGPNGAIDAFISAERVVLERLSADVEMQRSSKRQFLAHDFVKRFRKQSGKQARL